MCEKTSSSVEHAPPKCIFPELKDVSDGIKRRENLIKVPSCYEHNSEKSKDDEYLLYILSTSITSNKVGHGQALTKVKRAAERKPNLIKNLSKHVLATPFTNFNTNEKIDAIAIFLDGDRINSVLEKCARALYFHKSGKKFTGTAKVVNGFLTHTQEDSEKKLEAFIIMEKIFNLYPYFGKHPDVFKYKVIHLDNSAMFLLEFYGTSKAIVDLR